MVTRDCGGLPDAVGSMHKWFHVVMVIGIFQSILFFFIFFFYLTKEKKKKRKKRKRKENGAKRHQHEKK
jgi:phosphotransferase system  glucose/maltose/N-acetylglucosamine-specific IIC component